MKWNVACNNKKLQHFSREHQAALGEQFTCQHIKVIYPVGRSDIAIVVVV